MTGPGRATALVSLMLAGALAACQSESSTPDAGERSTDSASSPTVLTSKDVQDAEVLREGRGYKVVADPPSTIGSKMTFFLGMISSTEAFGTVREPSKEIGGGGDVVIYDTRSGKTQKLETLGKDSQVIGMTFSDSHVVWSESSTLGVSSGPWTIRSFDRDSATVQTVASAKDAGADEAPLADPEGGIPRISGDDVIFVAADSDNLPTTATAYRVPLNGSSKPEAIAEDVQGAYPSGDLVAVVRDGRFSNLDLATGEEKKVEPQRGSSDCPGFAAQGVYVECDDLRGAPRLTIVQSGGDVTEIRLPKASGGAATAGPAYFGASKDWVTFTFDDKVYVLDLGSKKLGRFDGAQYVLGGQSADNTIRYARMRTSATDVKPAPFVKLELG